MSLISDLVREELSVCKVPIVMHAGFPSPNFSTSHVESYNALLGMFNTLTNNYGVVPVFWDNQALYRY